MYDMDDKNYSLEYREARSNVVLAQFLNPSHNRDEFRRFVIGDFSQPKINKSVGFFYSGSTITKWSVLLSE